MRSKPALRSPSAAARIHAVGTPRSGFLPFLSGFSAYAALYFAFCFHPGLVATDDFGYLRSILGTLAAHRPYVYDWLEPYGAVFSGACALLYALTGNFLASTWGFQAICALASYPLLYRLLSARLRASHAALLSMSVAAFPLFLAKAADFHAGTCTLDLFLLALILHESRRYGWFFLAAFLAFANRQNQVCLLLLPLYQSAVGLKRGRTVTWQVPIGFVAWVAAAAFLVRSMNVTYAAEHAVFRNASIGPLATQGALALVGGVFMTLGGLAVGSSLTGRAFAWRRLSRGWFAPAFAALALLAFIPFWGPSLLRTDTPLFALVGWPQVNRALPWLLLLAIPAVDFRLLRPSPYLLLLAGYLAIASVRGVWWDYYFLEIALLCLLLALDAAPSPSLPRLSVFLLSASLCFDLGYAYLLRIQSDKQRLAVWILERLEREGKVSVDAMTGATFGHLGWKLFDHFIVHEGKEYGELQDFQGYVKKDRVVLETGLPWRPAFKSDLPFGADTLETGTCRIGFVPVRYRVADLHGPEASLSVMGRPMTLGKAGFLSPRYPLDNREWDALIQSQSGSEAVHPKP
jgi:hypothetical protein